MKILAPEAVSLLGMMSGQPGDGFAAGNKAASQRTGVGEKILEEPAHALILIVAVFVNIAVWFMEQHSDIDFEFLSVSYIITELFLIGVNAMVKENRRLKALIREKDEALHAKTMTGKTTKEILAELNIKENTLKFHNKNLYGKLGVTSRKS